MFILNVSSMYLGFPGGSMGEESTCQADESLIAGSGRSPGGGHGNPLQYSCLQNPRDRGAWQGTVHGAAESDTTEATEHTHKYICFSPLSSVLVYTAAVTVHKLHPVMWVSPCNPRVPQREGAGRFHNDPGTHSTKLCARSVLRNPHCKHRSDLSVPIRASS